MCTLYLEYLHFFTSSSETPFWRGTAAVIFAYFKDTKLHDQKQSSYHTGVAGVPQLP